MKIIHLLNLIHLTLQGGLEMMMKVLFQFISGRLLTQT